MPFRGGCRRAQKDTWYWQRGSKCPSSPCCPISVPTLDKGACALPSRREQVPPAPLLAGGFSGPYWSLSTSKALEGRGVVTNFLALSLSPPQLSSENTLQSLALSPDTTQSLRKAGLSLGTNPFSESHTRTTSSVPEFWEMLKPAGPTLTTTHQEKLSVCWRLVLSSRCSINIY